MNIIESNGAYQIYPEGLKITKKLEPKIYLLGFSQRQGFFLEEATNSQFKLDVEKIYGSVEKRANKVITAFDFSDRNLGVICHGMKGTGKTLFTKVLINNAIIARNMPVIIIDTYYPGVAAFIDSLEQSVAIVMDEFDKTFAAERHENGEINERLSPMTELLSILDGLNISKKKLFIFTCNDLQKISEFIIARPGRAHYSFEFGALGVEEVKEYVLDTIPDIPDGMLQDLICYSEQVALTYDMLRAICFEIDLWDYEPKLDDILADLNLAKNTSKTYNMTLEFNDGTKEVKKDVIVDMFGSQIYVFNHWCNTKQLKGIHVHLEFDPSLASFTSGYLTGGPAIYSLDKTQFDQLLDFDEDYLPGSDFESDEFKATAARLNAFCETKPIDRITFVESLGKSRRRMEIY